MSEVQRAALRRRLASLPDSARRALAGALSEEPGGTGKLTAFLVLESGSGGSNPGEPPTEEGIRAFLVERLPAYMIPARFAVLEHLPRTPAGKLDRRALARESGSGLESAVGAVVAPRTPIEATLAGIWRDVLRIDEVSIHDDFFEIGGDSLLSIRVIARAGREGLRIPIERFFENPTIAGLAAASGGGLTSEATDASSAEPAEQGVVTGEAPLTPIQHWFLDAIGEHRDHWNQTVLVEIEPPVTRAAVEAVVRLLVTHHDALRLRLTRRAGEWRQDFPPVPAEVPLRVVDLSNDDAAGYAERVEAECRTDHAALRIAEGSLFRCILFEGTQGWQRLLLLAHHLVVDAVSWEILLEDTATLLGLASTGGPLRPPAKTASAREWALGLSRAAVEPDAAASAGYWLAVTEDGPTRVPVDEPDANTGNLAGDATRCIVSLDEGETRRLLAEATPRLGVTTQAVLLGALLLAWRNWTGNGELLLDVEGHGRDVLGDALDVSRTVGWFTTVFPMRLAVPEPGASGTAPPAAEVVRGVQAALSALPLRGAAHGLLRWLAPDEAMRLALGGRPRPEVLFNYLGTRDAKSPPGSLVRLAGESTRSARHPGSPRAYVLEVNAYLGNGSLVFEVEYSTRLHRPGSIARFAEAIRSALRTIVTPAVSRFPLAALDESDMALVADLLAEADEE